MKLALVLLSVVALSPAAPQNYTTHFQIFHDSTTDPTPSSTNTTTVADGAVTAVNSTNGAAGTTSVGETLAKDNETNGTVGTHKVPSGSASSTNRVTSATGNASSVTAGYTVITEVTTVVNHATTYETKDATEATFSDSSKRKIGGITRTTGGATNGTTGVSKARDGRKETSISVTAGNDATSGKVESTTEEVFGTITEEGNDESPTDVYIKPEGVRTTTMPITDRDRSENKGNSNNIGHDKVEEPGFGFTFKLPSFFSRYLQTVPTIGSTTSNPTSSNTTINVHSNIESDVSSNAQSFNGGLINVITTATTTVSSIAAVSGNGFRPSGAEKNIVPTSSIDAASSNSSFSGNNSLATSDLNNQQAPLHQEHSAQVKQNRTESVRDKRSQGANGYSGLHLNPDYYVPSFIGVGRDNRDAYDYDYYSQSFQPVGTPEEYEEDYSQIGNNGGYSGHFQYIIRTSNLPGELTSFQTSPSLSALHPNSPDTYYSHGASSTGSQSDAGHVPLTSQTENHFSLFPAFQSSNNFNYTTNHRPSFGFFDFLDGSTITNADSSSGTQETIEYNSTTTRTSIASHTRLQQNNTDSFSGIQRPDGTYYSTTTEASITPVGNDQTSSVQILKSPNNAASSPTATNSSQFDCSKVTTEIDGEGLVTTTAEGTSNPKIGTNKQVNNSKGT